MKMGLFRKNCILNVKDPLAKMPDPSNFEIIEAFELKGNIVVAVIRYRNCNNFEGIKICVYDNMTTDKLKEMARIDPHFSESNTSPIARFKPNSVGRELAYVFAEVLSMSGGLKCPHCGEINIETTTVGHFQGPDLNTCKCTKCGRMGLAYQWAALARLGEEEKVDE